MSEDYPYYSPFHKTSAKLDVDDEFLKRVESMAGRGQNKSDIAYNVGVNPNTFSRYIRRYPEIDEAYQRGRANAKLAVSNVIFKKAIGGDLTAAIWYEKTRSGYSDKLDIKNETTVKVEPFEDYLRRIRNVGPGGAQEHEGQAARVDIGDATLSISDDVRSPKSMEHDTHDNDAGPAETG